MHNLDNQYKFTITPLVHMTALFERFISYNTVELYNKVQPNIKLEKIFVVFCKNISSPLKI